MEVGRSSDHEWQTQDWQIGQSRYTFFVTLDVASMCFNVPGHLCVHLVPRWVWMPPSSHQGYT